MSFPPVLEYRLTRNSRETRGPVTRDQVVILGAGLLIGVMMGLGISMLRDSFRAHDEAVNEEDDDGYE